MSELEQLAKNAVSEWRRYLDNTGIDITPQGELFVAMQRLDEAISTPKSRDGYYPAPGKNISEHVETDATKTTPRVEDIPLCYREALAAVFREESDGWPEHIEKLLNNLADRFDTPWDFSDRLGNSEELPIRKSYIGVEKVAYEAREAKVRELVAAVESYVESHGWRSWGHLGPIPKRVLAALDAIKEA